MNINLIDEILSSMRNVKAEGTSESQKEAYMQVASEMDVMFQNMVEHQSKFKKMANMVYEAGNNTLAEGFQTLAMEMNKELDAMDEMIQMARSVANQ